MTKLNIMINVSIIVPVFNTEKYLHRCIKSLLNQTLGSIEIILVNDASTDNSLSIMQDYVEKHKDKIQLINLKKNIKQGGAKNHGIKVAKGEYIGIVDSDDWVDHRMYNDLFREAKRSSADIVDSDYYESHGNNYLKEFFSIDKKIFAKSKKEIKKEIILSPGRMVTKIYKKSLFTNNNLFFTENRFYEDNELGPLLNVLANKVVKLNTHYYYYFINTQSTTRKINNYSYFDRLITAKNMLQRFKEKGLYDKYKEEIDFSFINQYYINTIFGCIILFNPAETKYMIKVQKEIQETIPTYRKNKYYKLRISLSKRIFLNIGRISPKLMVNLYALIKIIKIK